VIVELHCHSTCSDGAEAPEEIGRRARARGVDVFCLTDHDTTAGTEAAQETYGGRGLTGLELSCEWEDRTVHLLTYRVQPGPGSDALQLRLERIESARRERIDHILDRLDTLGVTLDRAPIRKRAAEHTPGRPDVARALVEQGVCSSIRDAFDRFLADGGPAYIPSEGLGLDEGLALGAAAGARMSLAHPHVFRSPALVDELIRGHRDRGLEGLEAEYGSYGRDQRQAWTRLADEHDMVVTGGSDFHGGGVLERIDRLGVKFSEDRAARLCDWLEIERA
jgi:predicted metal-dependent phosphoesterase TrpH